MTLLQLSIRNVRASLGRLLLTMAAIVLGVGFVAASLILADSLSDTFDAMLDSSTTGTDAVVVPTEPEFGHDIRPLTDDLIADVAAMPEVGTAYPALYPDMAELGLQPFVVVDDAGQRVEPRFGAQVVTHAWDGQEDDMLADATIVEGTPPVGTSQVAIDAGYAAAAGVEVRDRITLDTPAGRRSFELTAVVEESDSGIYRVLFDFESAQVLYGREGEVDAISLSRAPGVTAADMVTAVEGVVPEAASVSNLEDLIGDASAEIEQMIAVVRYVLLAFAGAALFVSLFIISNTFSILVAQRTRQIGMLRALGATRRQIRRSVVAEAAIIGVVGSLLGIGFGFVVASAVKWYFELGSGFETATVVAPRTIIVAVAVGVVATMVSALMPARAAGRVSPIAAMRNLRPTRSSWTRRTATGAAAVGLGVVLLALGLFGDGENLTLEMFALAVGAILTFVGVALLSALFAGPAVTIIGRAPVLGAGLLGLGLALLAFTVGGDGSGGAMAAAKVVVSLVAVVIGVSILGTWLRGGRRFGLGGSASGLAGDLARQNAARSPQRTAATATALTIGIALVSTVSLVGQSFKASFAETLERAITADRVILDDGANGLPLAGELADRMEEIDGVGAVSRIRFNEIRIGDDVEELATFEAIDGRSLIDFGVTSGTVDALPDQGILVQADEAEERSLAVGDHLVVDFPGGGSEQLVVAGIFEDNPLEVRWIIDLGVYERYVVSEHDDRVFLGFADGADPEAVAAAVLAVTDDYEAASVLDPAEFVASQEEEIDLIVGVINGMLGLTLFVAFLGVINTIVLSVIERTREVGLLRAVGMSRRQVRGTIRWESVIVCLFGAFLGIGLGVLFATAAVAALPDDVIGSVVVPYGTVVYVVLLAALAGILAAVLPARRAARLDVLDAIGTAGG